SGSASAPAAAAIDNRLLSPTDQSEVLTSSRGSLVWMTLEGGGKIKRKSRLTRYQSCGGTSFYLDYRTLARHAEGTDIMSLSPRCRLMFSSLAANFHANAERLSLFLHGNKPAELLSNGLP